MSEMSSFLIPKTHWKNWIWRLLQMPFSNEQASHDGPKWTPKPSLIHRPKRPEAGARAGHSGARVRGGGRQHQVAGRARLQGLPVERGGHGVVER